MTRIASFAIFTAAATGAWPAPVRAGAFRFPLQRCSGLRESNVRPPPRPTRTAARELRLHAGESRLGEAGDRQISGGPAGLGGDPDPVAGPGAVRRLDAARGDRTRRGYARHGADPGARSRDLLHHVPARAGRSQSPRPVVRNDAVPVTRGRGAKTSLPAAHPP